MPGTGSGFSGCCAATGSGACCFGATEEAGLAAGVWMLGASACATGCADFLVSLLSHATNKINPAPRATMLKRFTQHSNCRVPQSYLLLDASGRRTAAYNPGTFRKRGQLSLSHECKEKTPESAWA